MSNPIVCRGCESQKPNFKRGFCNSCWNELCGWHRGGGGRGNIRRRGNRTPATLSKELIDLWISQKKSALVHEAESGLVPVASSFELSRLENISANDRLLLSAMCDIVSQGYEIGDVLLLRYFMIGQCKQIDKSTIKIGVDRLVEFGVLLENIDDSWQVKSVRLAAELAERLRGGNDQAVAEALRFIHAEGEETPESEETPTEVVAEVFQEIPINTSQCTTDSLDIHTTSLIPVGLPLLPEMKKNGQLDDVVAFLASINWPVVITEFNDLREKLAQVTSMYAVSMADRSADENSLKAKIDFLEARIRELEQENSQLQQGADEAMQLAQSYSDQLATIQKVLRGE